MFGANRVRGPYRKQFCDECAEISRCDFTFLLGRTMSLHPIFQAHSLIGVQLVDFFNNVGGIATAYTKFVCSVVRFL